MKPMSKAYFLAWIFGPQVIAGVLAVIGIIVANIAGDRSGPDPAAFLVFLLLALISSIVGVVFACKLLYRLWTVIQGEDARTTPGKAVGFCFIPLFNFYWLFQAYRGWTLDYNKLVKRRGLNLPPAPEQIGLWYSICVCGQLIPCVNYLAGPAALVMYILFICKAIDSANALLAAQDGTPKAVTGQSDVIA